MPTSLSARPRRTTRRRSLASSCAASAPVDSEGVEVLALEVDPDHQRGGHGSRLLTACVDLARQEGARYLATGVLEGDEVRERFLAASGLGPDGGRRQLAIGTAGDDRSVVENRWTCLLYTSPSPRDGLLS